MIRIKALSGLLFSSVAMVGLSACNQQQPVPVAPAPVDHHDDGHDRDRHARQPPPPDQRDARPQDQRDPRRDKNPQDVPNPRQPQ
jgi:hypothetical protein